jgi:SpoVK/Ycf46/Vps4 family AAA+-type ATPase
LVEAYERYNLSELDAFERSLFNYMIARNVCRNENSFAWEDYCKLFAESTVVSGIYECIKAGFLILMKKGLVEHDSSDGFEHGELIRLSEKALREFLGDTAIIENARKKTENHAFRIISHDSVQYKELFFNDREQNELNRLSGLLKQDNFKKVIARLEEKGMRKGVACLFYGAPGTGKTASCYNVSAATGRDIYFVDMAQLKSKWVGESEQNLSNLFKAYHKAVAERELTPIMVWNEADAIFGRRRKVEHAVDKMENAMQNIILQELEDFEGILIATTNFSLKDGFDPAMERRFLIKVCFDKPEVNTRTKIWRSMFTDLSETDARTLATEYDLSGGLIENINRKATVDYILTGQKPCLSYLRELCCAEISGGISTKHIGFN